MKEKSNKMEDKLSQLNKFKQITLTDTERNMMRAHGAHIVTTMIPVVTESLFHRGVQHGLRIALSTFLFIVFVGGSVSVVANSAVPGDKLYAVKVDVNEELKALLLNSTEEKVIWQKNRIVNRVDEIKTLAETQTLTKAKQEIVKKALDGHVKALSKELSTLSDKTPNTALNVTASLEESLKASKIAIENTTEIGSTGKEDALKTVDDALKQVSDQEVKIISKEIDDIAGDVETIPSESSTTLTEPTPPISPETTTPVGP
jgi:hypothetical protein